MAKPSSIAQALRLIADAIELDEVRVVAPAPGLELLDEDRLFAEFGLKKSSADARGIPRARLGRKLRWKRSDVEASIKTEPPKARAKHIRVRATEDDDPLAALIASGAVRKGGDR